MPAKGHGCRLDAQVKRAVKEFRKLLGLPEWPVYYQAKRPEELDAEADRPCVAAIEVCSNDNEVYLKYIDTVRPDAVRRLVLHEMLHWLLADIDDLVISIMTDAKSPKVLVDAYNRLQERLIEALTIAIVQPNRDQPAMLTTSPSPCPLHEKMDAEEE